MLPWFLVLVLAVLFGLAMWGPLRESAPTPEPVTNFTIDLPSGEWLERGSNIALSPDGRRLVYVAIRDGISQLYLRQFDQFEAHPIAETEGVWDPFFSPDGEWVAFFTSHKLKKVSLSSGAVVTLCNASPVSSGGGWGTDDTIYFNLTPVGGLVRVSANGGTPQSVTTPDSTQGELGHYHPRLLPGGKAILFTIAESEKRHEKRPAVLSLKTGVWHSLAERGIRPHYLSMGHLVYSQGGALLAEPFDLDGLRVTGSPLRIIEGVMTWGRRALFSVSANGSLAYIPDTGEGSAYTLVWVGRDGQERPLPLTPNSYYDPRLSPDGTGLAIQITNSQTGNADVWLGGLTPPLTRFTFNANYDGEPTWTPDGKRVIFASVRAGHAPNLLWRPADGTAVVEPIKMVEHEQLNTVAHAQFATSMSPDGRALAFTNEAFETGLDIWLVDIEGQRKPQPWLTTEFTETAAVFSPDGRWIAYQSDESGRFEIYVRPFPGPGPTRRVSTDGGTEPLWSRDGGELFYRKGSAMMAVSVDTKRAFKAGQPLTLFKGSYQTSRIRANYDVSPDGKFLMVKGGEPSTQIKVVLNWSEELKRVVPIEK